MGAKGVSYPAEFKDQPWKREEFLKTVKPFCISKHDVVKAWKLVKANRGSAGVDGQSIEAFERNLKANLYKVWNRMSSGSYFPPPVKYSGIIVSYQSIDVIIH